MIRPSEDWQHRETLPSLRLEEKKRRNAVIRARNEGCLDGARTKEETQPQTLSKQEGERYCSISNPVL